MKSNENGKKSKKSAELKKKNKERKTDNENLEDELFEGLSSFEEDDVNYEDNPHGFI